MVRSDLIIEPQPSRRDEKARQQKNVYRPSQQFVPLGDDIRSAFYNGRGFNVIYRKLVRAICRVWHLPFSVSAQLAALSYRPRFLMTFMLIQSREFFCEEQITVS